MIPYDQRLARFPAYLQQLEMESNGKSVDLAGEAIETPTGAVVFGEPGTNAQQRYFDSSIRARRRPSIFSSPHPHRERSETALILVANCLAQSEALFRGRAQAEVEAKLKTQGLDAAAIAALAPHKVFTGNRPSSTFLYKSLTPHARPSRGAL